ncbi:MAG: SsrA-binding protein SmpB [Rickettsiales bacterium]|jgi:SsrA-binding protein|nr:SsrA-binding protein SmpB [Rickettsiales bacterium]
MAGKADSSSITVANNRKAFANYAIEEEFEAGLVLTGTEVKSLRAGKANIADAYAGPKGEELWLFNATIAPYAGGNRFNHEERRPRKLLMHKRQINKLIGRLKVKGVTLVPLALYFNSRGMAKIKLGLGTGKKEYEKRDTIKQRDWQRDKARIMREKNH